MLPILNSSAGSYMRNIPCRAFKELTESILTFLYFYIFIRKQQFQRSVFPKRMTIILLAIRKINKYHQLYTNCRINCPHACTRNAAKNHLSLFPATFLTHGGY